MSRVQRLLDPGYDFTISSHLGFMAKHTDIRLAFPNPDRVISQVWGCG